MLLVMWHENKMLQAFCLALVTEIAILLLLCIGFAGVQQWHKTDIMASAIIQLNGSPAENRPHLAPLAQKKSLPVPRHQVKPTAMRHKAVIHESVPNQLTGQTPVAEPTSTPLVSGNPAGSQDGFTGQMATLGGSGGKEDALTLYAAQVKAAVQAAVEYPTAANNLRIKSRTRVEFSLRDGVPQHPHIIISSGLGVFDHAAIHVVEIAHYPAPPAVFRGQTKLFQVWVEFHR